MQNNLNSVLTYTKNEKEAVLKYRIENHDYVNALLERSIDREIYLEENKVFPNINQEYLENIIKQILNIYSIMCKNIKKNYTKPTEKFFRAEMYDVFKNIESTSRINKIFGAITKEEIMEQYYQKGELEKKAALYITKEENVPCIYMKDVTEDTVYENEILIAPFTTVIELKEIGRFKEVKDYNMKLANQKVLMVSDIEVNELQRHIFNNVERVVVEFKKYLEAEKDIKKQTLQRDTLTFRLSDRTLSKEDRLKIDNEIEKISLSLNKDLDILTTYKDNYIEWKDNTIYYIKYLCEKIKQNIDIEYQKELEQAKNVIKEEEIDGYKDMLTLSRQNALDKIIKNKKGVMQIITSLNRIEVKQEKFKDLGMKIRVNYIPYCNVEKDLYEVNILLERIDKLKLEIQNLDTNVVDGLAYDKQNEKISNILHINMDIEKWVTDILDKEMHNINKGELICFKKGIAHKIEETKALANIKVIHDENEKIITKSNLRKILDKITGQAKKDQIVMKQNEIKEKAIKEKLNTIKYEQKEEYSTHEMVADLDIYIKDNIDKEILAQDIHRLKKLRNNIGEIFKLQEEKVEKIIENRLKNNLPVELDKKKYSKEDKARIETENWIIKNGYTDNVDVTIDDLIGQSQALLANETKRLLNYIEEKQNNK